jgi:3-hydroxybutyryl-CoA dehydrogenase
MRVVIIADDRQWEEWPAKASDVEWIRVEHADHFLTNDADIYVNLKDAVIPPFYSSITKNILISAVTQTLVEMNAPPNVIRINGWAGFLQRRLWEVAGPVDDKWKQLFDGLGKKIIPVPDEPGLIAARVIAMIINEAYFALGDNVSSKEEIDIAMKLGTNYPFGPFQWAEMIGIKNVYDLLAKLNKTDCRYKPAPALESEVKIK